MVARGWRGLEKGYFFVVIRKPSMHVLCDLEKHCKALPSNKSPELICRLAEQKKYGFFIVVFRAIYIFLSNALFSLFDRGAMPLGSVFPALYIVWVGPWDVRRTRRAEEKKTMLKEQLAEIVSLCEKRC